METKTRVGVTGCGLVCSIGGDSETSWRNLLDGRRGQREIRRFDTSRHRIHHACPVTDIPEPDYDPGHPLDDASKLLMGAAGEALGEKAGEFASAPAFVATTLGGMDSGTRFYRSYLQGAGADESGVLLKDYMPFMQSRHLMKKFRLEHMPLTVTNACSSGTNAIGLAYLAVKSGRADRAIAAGYDIVSEFVFSGFNALRLIAPDCCRPFDAGRQGLVLGEAAGVILLENMDSAERRGKKATAEIAGYASGSEAYHVTKPHPEGEGAFAVMNSCLEKAGVRPEEVECVNAHGTGTLQNDVMEAKAISKLFGGSEGITATANKSAVGHTLGAAGVVEAVFSILSIRDGVVPPTVNTSEPLPELESVELVRDEARKARIQHVLSSSFGFGGTNACVLFSETRS
ncbi:MAG: beta-ketoacyl-[acyl-carrier-protein] synthase family protein [Kiritimatiellia bacterium]